MSRNLILRFCCAKEINKSRQKLLLIKSVFLAKLNFMKTLGQKFQLMTKAESFIDSHIDLLSENYLKQKKRNEKRKQLTYTQILFKKELE